ncbi:aspartyl-phosphate phosphatase Spo0E family protein [Alicyclobacillus mengziensis]|uniref:Aspartyl-phosphate phosphatase Spo0E family protein n=1 Tax=Alicyclobacillus mengziensis TaxID=2931921 RepID=A0A9X7Z8K0_9BACL|nr:aspartyl-phosphate phosphatase Spo0E family protein [Alicyclobacillus mengziensis]
MYEYADIIEYLREKLIQLAEVNGSLLHRDVITVSQELDKYILQAQKQSESYRQLHDKPVHKVVTGPLLAWG